MLIIMIILICGGVCALWTLSSYLGEVAPRYCNCTKSFFIFFIYGRFRDFWNTTPPRVLNAEPSNLADLLSACWRNLLYLFIALRQNLREIMAPKVGPRIDFGAKSHFWERHSFETSLSISFKMYRLIIWYLVSSCEKFYPH